MDFCQIFDPILQSGQHADLTVGVGPRLGKILRFYDDRLRFYDGSADVESLPLVAYDSTTVLRRT